MANPNLLLDDKNQGYFIYVWVSDPKGGGDWVLNSSRYYVTIRGVRSALKYAVNRSQYGKYRVYGAFQFGRKAPFRLSPDDHRLDSYIFEQEIKPEILIY